MIWEIIQKYASSGNAYQVFRRNLNYAGFMKVGFFFGVLYTYKEIANNAADYVENKRIAETSLQPSDIQHYINRAKEIGVHLNPNSPRDLELMKKWKYHEYRDLNAYIGEKAQAELRDKYFPNDNNIND